MARKRKGEPPDFGKTLQAFGQAYDNWEKWCGYHSHLKGERFALSGAKLHKIPAIYQKEVETAYKNFDRAIMDLVTIRKTALADPRVLKRVEQAEWMGDKTFFEDLAEAVKRNVGIDERTSKEPAVGVVYHCAVHYLHGNEDCIREEYSRWEEMDIDKRRREKPKDRNFQFLLAHWQETKDSLTQMGLENFRARVKRMAEALRRNSMPIPVPMQKK